MNILYVIDSLGSGGAERSTLLLAEYFASTGANVSVVALKRKAVGIEEEFRELPIDIFIAESNNKLQRLSFLMKTINKVRPSLIHSVLYESNVLIRFASLFIDNIPIVQSLVNTPYLPNRSFPGRLGSLKLASVRLFDRWTSRLSPLYFHAVSKTVIDHYQSIYPLTAENTHLVARGREPQDDLVTPEFPSSICRVINVGRQDAQKDQYTAVRAMHLLTEVHRIHHAVLSIYGREGSETNAIKNYITKHELGNIVKLPGFTRSINDELKASHVFLFSSLFEGAAGAMVEAMSWQLPIVCSDTPVHREIIGSDNGALFFPTGDAEHAAFQLSRLMRDKELYERLSNASYRRFTTNYTQASVLERYGKMYEQILSSHR